MVTLVGATAAEGMEAAVVVTDEAMVEADTQAEEEQGEDGHPVEVVDSVEDEIVRQGLILMQGEEVQVQPEELMET